MPLITSTSSGWWGLLFVGFYWLEVSLKDSSLERFPTLYITRSVMLEHLASFPCVN